MAQSVSAWPDPWPTQRTLIFWDKDYINASPSMEYGLPPDEAVIRQTQFLDKTFNASTPTNNLWGHKKEYEIPEELGFQEPPNKDQFLLFPE